MGENRVMCLPTASRATIQSNQLAILVTTGDEVHQDVVLDAKLNRASTFIISLKLPWISLAKWKHLILLETF